MEIQPPDREPRGSLRDRYNQLTTKGLIALYLGKYTDCERIFSEQYKLLFDAQDQEKPPIHKGLPLHNRGLALFHQGKQEDAIRNFLLAYIEDTLNVGYLFISVRHRDFILFTPYFNTILQGRREGMD